MSISNERKNGCPIPDDGGREPREHLNWVRPVIQIGFVVFSVLLGLQFRSFVLCLGAPADRSMRPRPAAVEAYLPISSLLSLTYLAKTGTANRVHPAGLVIFTVTLALALSIRRGFCSWVCPIGTAEEWAYRIGRRLWGRNLQAPRWLDLTLRSLKYGLLGFFLYHIVLMPTGALREFIYSPYNRIADVKMYLFFRDISAAALTVIIVLGFLSLLFKNFLCRYLCPYGALLGLCSALSPVAIRRNEERCIGCGRCRRACPNQIPVDEKKTVRSPECTACFRCVGACQVHGAIGMCWPKERMRISVLAYGVITVAAFFFAAQAARTVEYWDAKTSAQMYQHLYGGLEQISHP